MHGKVSLHTIKGTGLGSDSQISFVAIQTFATRFSCRNGYRVPNRKTFPVCNIRVDSDGALKEAPLLAFITPNGVCKEPARAVKLCQEALNGGSSIVQLRDRGASLGSLRLTAQCIVEAIDSPGSLVINGPWSISLAAQLGNGVGVHLRECDIEEMMPGALCLDELTTSSIVGCSVHSVEAAQRAARYFIPTRPSYLQVGTMFPTHSHPGKVPEGPELLREVRRAVGGTVTILGVGGVTISNAPQIVGPGLADGAAVISGIASSTCPAEAARELRNELQKIWYNG